MLSSEVLIASGPTLIAIEGAVALILVHRRLSGTPYALAWAAAFIAFALHFILGGMLAALAGMIGLLLFVEGFRVRAIDAWPSRGRLLVAGAIAIGALAVMQASRAESIWPAVICGSLLYAMSHLVPRGARASPVEIAVAVVLGIVAAIELVLAIAGLANLAPGERAWLSEVSPALVLAAGSLFAMLLIASDFAGELRWTLHTDPLTGVLNRAGFEQAARETLARAEASTQPVSIAIADIDHFKAINDRHGHAIGDAALACVAEHLAGVAGDDDLVGRIGGEEFAMLLWNADEAAAHSRIEPIRASLPARSSQVHKALKVTVSIGIAQRAGTEAMVPMLDRADRALYQSKREGRDRTTLASAMA